MAMEVAMTKDQRFALRRFRERQAIQRYRGYKPRGTPKLNTANVELPSIDALRARRKV